MSPGSRARFGSTCPEPMANGEASFVASPSSLIGLPELSSGFAVVIIADLIAAGLQVGCAALRRAATPEAWGHAMDVPDIRVYSLDKMILLPIIAAPTEGT
uniref:Uncharacterized protein n=1 Tax=Opuntia streptacantha TaxID=393608 RepID=A0A7C8Z953_OPUST